MDLVVIPSKSNDYAKSSFDGRHLPHIPLPIVVAVYLRVGNHRIMQKEGRIFAVIIQILCHELKSFPYYFCISLSVLLFSFPKKK